LASRVVASLLPWERGRAASMAAAAAKKYLVRDEGTPGEEETCLEVHSRVPCENWCVNILDFDDFVERARELHHEGTLQDGDQGQDGPSLHAVNELLVIPETQKVGGISWALMLRPEGRPLGVYVSHSFQTGIYDFHRKVRGSMPGGESDLWCRLLSLPQSSELVSTLFAGDPRTESPLAKAIPHATVLLVVPNAQESVFRRSWCVLEACVAFENRVQVLPAIDTFQCSGRRTSVGSTSHAAAKISNALPQALRQLFAGFESVRDAWCDQPEDGARIAEALRGKEDWLDGQIRSELLGML